MSAVNHIMACKDGNYSKSVATGIVAGSAGAVAGWITARIFTHITPMVGLAFGASATLGGFAAAQAFLFDNRVFGDSLVENIAKFILIFLAYIASGYLGALCTGCQLTIEASLALGVLMSLATTISVIGSLYILHKIGN